MLVQCTWSKVPLANPKAYVCVFVSLSVKVVHLEPDCLRRFITRRGRPMLMWSHHSTNFVGVNRILKEFLHSHKTNEIVSDFVLIKASPGSLKRLPRPVGGCSKEPQEAPVWNTLQHQVESRSGAFTDWSVSKQSPVWDHAPQRRRWHWSTHSWSLYHWTPHASSPRSCSLLQNHACTTQMVSLWSSSETFLKQVDLRVFDQHQEVETTQQELVQRRFGGS